MHLHPEDVPLAGGWPQVSSSATCSDCLNSELSLPWLRCAWNISTISWASSSKLKIHEVMSHVCSEQS